MQGKTRELWMDLCMQAAEEHDTDKLILFVRQINDLLEEKEQRSKRQRATDPYTRGADC
jgi:hypothetical protein